MTSQNIALTDLIGGTVSIRKTGKTEWTVVQRNYGPEHDNNHNPTWLRVENMGAAAQVCLRVKWAAFLWMGLRKFAYLKRGDKWEVITGRIDTTTTAYTFTVPRGALIFGVTPWYSNEDAERFVQRMLKKNDLCRSAGIGRSGEGRDILRLTIGKEDRPNVVILGREHANETSGSFAVEATADYLLSPAAPKGWLDKYQFHFLPIVNPDGVAHGTKLTQPGPVSEFDMVMGGMTSRDPTIVALRKEMQRLKPAALIMHHAYLFSSPFVGCYDKKTMMAALDILLGRDTQNTIAWLARITGPEKKTLRSYCRTKFGTVVFITELPWYGRTPDTIRSMGVETFIAMMQAADLP